MNLADQTVALLRLAVDQIDEDVVHGAVIAAVENHDLLAPGRRARPAQHEAVGVARGHRELPVRQPETAREFFADPRGVFARQHGRQTALRLRGERSCDGRRRMAEHRAGVAEAEVRIAVTVHIGERSAARLFDVKREGRRPVVHPVQRHAEQQVARRAFGQRARLRHGLDERAAFAFDERLRARPVDAVTGIQLQLHALQSGCRPRPTLRRAVADARVPTR